jgi:CDP-diacylglycerol---glycerol-3-phosphate 3-phosphatidyltransferase
MPSIYALKPKFQSLLRPIVAALARAGVTANQVTIAAVVLALLVAIALVTVDDRSILIVLPIALVVRMALNAIDGMLAREHAQASRLGAILNETGDVAGDALMYLPLMFRPEFPRVGVLLVVALSFVVETVGLAAVQIGASRRYDGPFGKSDRAFVFGALALLLGLGVPGGDWVVIVLGAACGLAAVTCVTRARAAIAEAKAREKNA